MVNAESSSVATRIHHRLCKLHYRDITLRGAHLHAAIVAFILIALVAVYGVNGPTKAAEQTFGPVPESCRIPAVRPGAPQGRPNKPSRLEGQLSLR